MGLALDSSSATCSLSVLGKTLHLSLTFSSVRWDTYLVGLFRGLTGTQEVQGGRPQGLAATGLGLCGECTQGAFIMSSLPSPWAFLLPGLPSGCGARAGHLRCEPGQVFSFL